MAWFLIYFMFSSIGTPINKRPVLGYRNLNLFKLFRLVHKLGGFDNVSITFKSETFFMQHVFSFKIIIVHTQKKTSQKQKNWEVQVRNRPSFLRSNLNLKIFFKWAFWLLLILSNFQKSPVYIFHSTAILVEILFF